MQMRTASMSLLRQNQSCCSLSVLNLYQTCYPLGVTSCPKEEDEELFENLEEEKLTRLITALGNTVFKQVLKKIEKMFELGQVLISPHTAALILEEIVYQGEREPYGVKGGTLVVLFSDRLGKVEKIGKFPLDSSTISTYEIHLSLVENRSFKVVLENLVRKMSGKDRVLLVGSKFKLEKRKLYRSSTCSVDSI